MVQVPLIGFIGRLDYQKGADLVLGAAPWLLNQDVQIICLGTGDKHLEVMLTFSLLASHHANPFHHPAVNSHQCFGITLWASTDAADFSPAL